MTRFSSTAYSEWLASVTAMDSAVNVRVSLRLLAQIGLLEDVCERDRRRQIHLWPVKSRIDMQTPMRHVAARLEHKRTQRENMMAYSESADCRRRRSRKQATGHAMDRRRWLPCASSAAPLS